VTEIEAMEKSHAPILDVIASAAYSKRETVENSFVIACRAIIEGVPGSIVECGVANGSQIGAMALADQSLRANRKIVLFDSFEGIPLAGPNDADQPGIGAISHDVNVPKEKLLVSSGVSSCSVDGVKGNFRKWGIGTKNCEFVKGWFQNTVHGYKDPIAVLRLDGDLYESTKVCLEALYGLVSPGGFVIIDDYALPGCAKAVHEFMNCVPPYTPVAGTELVIWWKK